MLEAGQPMHAFDFDKLQNLESKSKAKKIIVRFAAKGESIDVLGDKKYPLTPQALVIADETGPLALAGIKGGKRAEIDSKTSTIVIEAANFDPKSIRRTSRGLGLQTDASLRFEHGLDPNETEGAAQRVAELVGLMAGGQILAGMADRYPTPVKPKKIILGLENIEAVLGEDIQSARVKKILESLGFSVRKGTGLNLEVIAPTRRADAAMPPDLIEEIGRISGYDVIAAQLPSATIMPPVKNFVWQWKNTVKDALVNAGYSEVRNYSFVCENDCNVFGFPKIDVLEIKNPVNADLRFMRPSLLPNLLKNIKKNSMVPDLRQFEIGKIFGASLRMEPTMIAGVDSRGDFLEMKGALEHVCRKLGIKDFQAISLEAGIDMLFQAGQSARIFANGKEIGICGKVNRDITDALGIEPISAFELSLDVLSILATEETSYRALPLYPEASRDVAVVAPMREYAENIADIIRNAGGHLVHFVKPIDIYRGAEIASGTKSIVFRITYLALDRTLSGMEIDGLQNNIVKTIESRGWQVRK
jgi:phenylalanyl-tRNA synthetase beta chain